MIQERSELLLISSQSPVHRSMHSMQLVHQCSPVLGHAEVVHGLEMLLSSLQALQGLPHGGAASWIDPRHLLKRSERLRVDPFTSGIPAGADLPVQEARDIF